MRCCAVWLLALSAGHAAPPAAAPEPDPKTVVLWHFDGEDVTRAVDQSAAGQRHGVVTGAHPVAGRFGRALAWDESNGQVRTTGDFSAITDAFTLSAWIKLDQMPTGKPPLWCADVVGKLGSFGINIRPPGIVYVAVQLGEQRNYLLGQTKIPLGEWVHLALVYDGPAERIGIFVNGAIDTEFRVVGDQRRVNLTDSPFYARSYGGSDEKLIGAIDEVHLTGRAETFGYAWKSSLGLHVLRYQSALMLNGRLTPADRAGARALRLTLTDAGGRIVKQADLPFDAIEQGAVVRPDTFAAGTYQGMVAVVDQQGAARELLRQEIRYTPPDRGLVDFRDDGVCLLRGKPFLPLGLYHVRRDDLKRVAGSGANLALAWSSTFPPDHPTQGDGVGYLDQAGRAGLLSAGLGGGVRDPRYGEKTLTHYRGSRDVLFWYLDDEPHGPGRTPEESRQRYEQWAAWDPTHPVFLLHNKPAEFHAYGPACDVFATDPYPIRREPDCPTAMVADYTRAAVDAVSNRKPVWIALQCYTTRSTAPETRARDLLPRLPTPAELRCMSYMALAAGARGLLYYAFDDTYYHQNGIRGVNLMDEFPEFWAAMSGILKELDARTEVWCAPYAAREASSETPGVIAQRRPYLVNGQAHLLVVNSTAAPVPATIKVTGLGAAGEAPDLLGGRPARIAAGAVVDELEPRQAKCYVLP